MDFSFEKTNSAYMLFYERSTSPLILSSGSSSELMQQLSLPGGSSQMQMQIPVPQQSPVLPSSSGSNTVADVIPTFELNKELEDWIWMDNTSFLRDKNIFEHAYFKWVFY